MSWESSNNPYWLQTLPASEQQFIQGNMLDLEFQTTEDKMLFRDLYHEYVKPTLSQTYVNSDFGDDYVYANGIMD